MTLGRYIARKSGWYLVALVATVSLNFLVAPARPGQSRRRHRLEPRPRRLRHRRASEGDLRRLRRRVRSGRAAVAAVPDLPRQGVHR
ncbi:hypothetical protein [Brachybacterium sp. GPGPB12]|uniref:hypothetical protein n=1 Tax=Brachybacterium sp. GPGPB12 TaxID=3023517 RepID=UPI00313424A9